MTWKLKWVKTKGYDWSSKNRKERYQVNLVLSIIAYFAGIGLAFYSLVSLANLHFLTAFAAFLAGGYFFLIFMIFGQSTEFLYTIDRLDKIDHKLDALENAIKKPGASSKSHSG